jgi:hypothetical protein
MGVLRRQVASTIALALVAGLAAGCRARPRAAPVPTVPVRHVGSAEDAVIRQPVTVDRSARGLVRYHGDAWALAIPAGSAWETASDPSATLALRRTAGGVAFELAVRAYAIRDGMPLRTFVAAHSLWAAEEGAAPVEYVWDTKARELRGYSVSRDRESHYAFRVAGDRGYVIEASATGGTFSGAAADEFSGIAQAFRCEPRHTTAPEPAPPSR